MTNEEIKAVFQRKREEMQKSGKSLESKRDDIDTLAIMEHAVFRLLSVAESLEVIAFAAKSAIDFGVTTHEGRK